VELEVRRAKATDCADVCELATALVGFDADRLASFEAALADPDHDLIVAGTDSAIVGYAHLMVYPDLTHGALAGQLLSLIVREDMRRQGIATALMREIIRLARERGVGEFHINTEPDNEAAKALYARLGAEVVGIQMEVELETEDEQ
jgi:ribosomal protein S18 acetylase RimI-like enzyme